MVEEDEYWEILYLVKHRYREILDSGKAPLLVELLEKIRDYAHMEWPAPDEDTIRNLDQTILHLAPDDLPSSPA